MDSGKAELTVFVSPSIEPHVQGLGIQSHRCPRHGTALIVRNNAIQTPSGHLCFCIKWPVAGTGDSFIIWYDTIGTGHKAGRVHRVVFLLVLGWRP